MIWPKKRTSQTENWKCQENENFLMWLNAALSCTFNINRFLPRLIQAWLLHLAAMGLSKATEEKRRRHKWQTPDTPATFRNVQANIFKRTISTLFKRKILVIFGPIIGLRPTLSKARLDLSSWSQKNYQSPFPHHTHPMIKYSDAQRLTPKYNKLN